MAYYGGGSQSGNLMTSTAMGEKTEMQDLNNRLAGYMQRVRDLRQQGTGLDPAKYHDAMRLLEDELNKLKNLYEGELARLRRDLDDANRQKNMLANGAGQNRSALDDMQKKLSAESGLGRRAQEEANNLNRALAQKEKELADLMAALKARDAELDRLRPENSRLARELDDLRNKLTGEADRRQNAEDKANQLGNRLNFDNNKNDQENKDLRERLRAANDIIQNLEARLRQLGQGNGEDLARLMQKLRDGTMEELKRYQRETEDALNKNLRDLRSQIDKDSQDKDRLARENANLQDALRQAQQRASDLDGQNQALRQQVAALGRELEADRARANAQIRDLDGKVKDLQNQLMGNVQDFNKARDAQASLRAEIDTYSNLLDVEGPRMSGSQRLTPAASPAYGRPPTMAPPAYADVNRLSTSGVQPQQTQQPTYASGQYGRPASGGGHLPQVTPFGLGHSGYTTNKTVHFGPNTTTYRSNASYNEPYRPNSGYNSSRRVYSN